MVHWKLLTLPIRSLLHIVRNISDPHDDADANQHERNLGCDLKSFKTTFVGKNKSENVTFSSKFTLIPIVQNSGL